MAVEEEKPSETHDAETAAETEIDENAAVVPVTETEENPEEPQAKEIEENWEEMKADDVLEKPEEGSKDEELSVVQIQEDIEANRKAAVNILKQIKKRKKEIKDHEKE